MDRREFIKAIGKFSAVVVSVAIFGPAGCDDEGKDRDYRDYEDEYDDYTNFYDNYENSYIDSYMEHYDDGGPFGCYADYQNLGFP